MSTDFFENYGLYVTRFGAGKGKTKLQITHSEGSFVQLEPEQVVELRDALNQYLFEEREDLDIYPTIHLERDSDGLVKVSIDILGKFVELISDPGVLISHFIEPRGIHMKIREALK